jgi:hypothetical protein
MTRFFSDRSRCRSRLPRKFGVVALAIATLGGGGVAMLATGLASAAVSGTALINRDSVTGSPSVEARAR